MLFLDEIQAVPEAIPALRYLYEDRPGLPVLAAGSLLELTLRAHDFSMPVGRVEYLHLGPMTFNEFLLALGEENLVERLRSLWTSDLASWPQTAHRRLSMLSLPLYMVCELPRMLTELRERGVD